MKQVKLKLKDEGICISIEKEKVILSFQDFDHFINCAVDILGRAREEAIIPLKEKK